MGRAKKKKKKRAPGKKGNEPLRASEADVRNARDIVLLVDVVDVDEPNWLAFRGKCSGLVVVVGNGEW